MSLAYTHAPHGSPRALGRTIAALFLATIVAGVIAQVGISDRLILLRDPARTVAMITTRPHLYLAGFTLYMVEMAAQVAFTVLFFHLLRPVNGRVASIALAFGLVGCTIKIASRVFYLAPLFLLQHPATEALAREQPVAITLAMLTVNDRGAGVALAFFGVETLLQGWLVLRSTFLPRWLGALVIVSGIGWLTFLFPAMGYAAFNVVAPFGLLASVAMIGWLLVKGVDEPRWHALAASSATPN
jgi:hypothetical protein